MKRGDLENAPASYEFNPETVLSESKKHGYLPGKAAAAALAGPSATPEPPTPGVGKGGRSGGAGATGRTTATPRKSKPAQQKDNGEADAKDADSEDEERTYVVRKGDTLSKIAQRTYGSAAEYSNIARHNLISNPNLIREGQSIRLPSRRGQIKSPSGKR